MIITGAIVTLVFLFINHLYFKWKRKENYWNKKGLPYVRPLPIVGNFGSFLLQRETQFECVDRICKTYPDSPYIGAFFGTDPVLIVQDPEVVKLVTTKEFNSFSGKEIINYVDSEVFFRNVSSAYGDGWKLLRQNLTPIFTSGKMRNMFPLVQTCCRMYEDLLDKTVKNNNVVNVRTLSGTFGMETLCSSVFGVDTDVMLCKNIKSNPFKLIGDKMLKLSTLRQFKLTVRAMWPQVFYGLRQQIVPDAATNFFFGLLRDIIKERQGNPTNTQGFMDILMEWKRNYCIEGDRLGNKGKITRKVDDDLIISQCLLFFVAGLETSSLTSAMTLLELSKNKDCLRKVQAEVDEYFKQRKCIEYDVITEVPYLWQCVEESLRLHPVVPIFTRECTEMIQLPGELVLKPGDRVHVPAFTLHRDPRYFPDPLKFIPDRFSSENRHNIKPSTYLPFGEGPRICMGTRFAKMQVLSGLVTLLKKYDLSPTGPSSGPVRYDTRGTSAQPVGGVHIKLTPREKGSLQA